ncbi:hypothetical protein QVD17_20515 [Tagetes erecta]|uniref:SWIM-type domain-containing protein n=1 Tax=Tagetes erecta TaxID=13708 RepID=A0AAD8KLV9_TARER|nr:hypothetical protein QVD17_20515 [Tagetes erecta]
MTNISTYNPQHTCLQSRSVKAFTADWLSKEILMEIQSNPDIPIKAIQEKMQQKYNMTVSKMKAFRAKTQALNQARSYFTGRAKTDVLLNNMCEVLNSRLVDGRDKPIITALEFVREYLMKRIVNVGKVIEQKNDFLTLNVKKKFDIIKNEANNLTVKWNGGQKYQVTCYNGEQYVVDVVQKTCSCRRWELVGIPCKHAVATIWDMSLNGEGAEIPEKLVDPCYWLSTWKEVYSHKIGPISGRIMWPKSCCPTKLIEPKHHTPIGRPRKMRKKDAMEKEDNMVKGGKLSRKLKTVTCGKCGNKGHNKKTCTGQGDSSSSRQRGASGSSQGAAAGSGG